jgi:3-oxoadipate enol-lactonase
VTRATAEPGALQRLDVVDGELAYRVDGTAGPWILAAHSLASSHCMWDAQVAALTGSHRLLRFDLRGHGASSAVAGEGSVDQCVDDAIALMDHLRIDAAHFLGLSLGGAIGIALAIRHPQRVQSVIACCCRIDAPAAYVDAWRERLALVERDGMAAVAEPTLARWFTPQAFKAPLMSNAIGAARRQLLATPVAGYRYGIQALLSLNEADRLASIRTPTMLVAGNVDTAVPPSVMAAMHAGISSSRLVVLDDAAHLCNVEQAARFDALLLQWLRERS